MTIGERQLRPLLDPRDGLGTATRQHESQPVEHAGEIAEGPEARALGPVDSDRAVGYVKAYVDNVEAQVRSGN